MEIWNSIPWNGFGVAASILGLLLTLRVLWELHKLKTLYLFKARLPELLEKISELASSVSDLLTNYDSSAHEIALRLGELEVLLGSVRDKTDGQAKVSTTNVLEKVKDYPKQKSADRLREIYVDLRKLDLELRELRQDLEWES